jgi:hypothetical protein
MKVRELETRNCRAYELFSGVLAVCKLTLSLHWVRWTLVCGSMLHQTGRNVFVSQSDDDQHCRAPYWTSESYATTRGMRGS